MKDINYSYDELKKQLEDLKEKALMCTKPNKAVAFAETYNVLSYFYYLSTGEIFDSGNINKNKFLNYISMERKNQIRNRFDANFINNKDNHISLFSSFFFDASEYMEEYLNSSEYLEHVSKYSKVFDESTGEDKKVLYNFFEEVDPSMIKLYEDLVKNNLFFCAPTTGRSGYTVFNPVYNKCNVFLEDGIPTVERLTTLVHEMGHVKDFLDFRERFGANDQGLYISKTSYSEVLSTMYQQMFYQFLIDNDIRRDEAVIAMSDYYTNYLSGVDDALLLSLMPERYYKSLVAGDFNRDEILSIIDCEGPDSHDIDFNHEEDSYLMETPDFGDSFDYTYGIILANNLIDDKEVYEKFMNSRKGYLDMKKLNDIGINEETTQKKFMKNMTKYLK